MGFIESEETPDICDVRMTLIHTRTHCNTREHNLYQDSATGHSFEVNVRKLADALINSSELPDAGGVEGG